MIRQNLEPGQPLNLLNFSKLIGINSENDYLDETDFGNWKEQIVPSIYLRQNEFFRLNFNSAERGLHLKMISTKSKIALALEFPDTIFLNNYNPSNSKFSLLLLIDRASITRFTNEGIVHFMALKAKKSYEIMQRVPVRGLLTGLIVRGAIKLAAKAEDDLIEKEGNQFTLYFIEGGVEKKIDIIVDAFYVEEFSQLLSLHWNKTAPPKIETASPKSGGCFIATACYGNYNHPVVKDLRIFRDDFLAKYNWGKSLIIFYYRHSPQIAQKISEQTILKICIRILFIYPIHACTKLIRKSSFFL